MSEIEQQIIDRLDKLEREVAFLRVSVRMNTKTSGSRVYVAEVAARFGVSPKTIHRMQFDFAGLHKIEKQTEPGRVYFDRKDYEKWLDSMNGKTKPRGLLRQTKKEPKT